jgi:hypothetical protein
MKNRLYILLCCIVSTTCLQNLVAKAFYASEFNATYNCANPLTITESTFIRLDTDIIIDGCLPFTADPLLNSQATLTFTSTASYRVIIKASTIFNIPSFLSGGQTIIFSGNAQLIIETGSKIIYGNNSLKAIDNAQIIYTTSTS